MLYNDSRLFAALQTARSGRETSQVYYPVFLIGNKNALLVIYWIRQEKRKWMLSPFMSRRIMTLPYVFMRRTDSRS